MPPGRGVKPNDGRTRVCRKGRHAKCTGLKFINVSCACDCHKPGPGYNPPIMALDAPLRDEVGFVMSSIDGGDIVPLHHHDWAYLTTPAAGHQVRVCRVTGCRTAEANKRGYGDPPPDDWGWTPYPAHLVPPHCDHEWADIAWAPEGHTAARICPKCRKAQRRDYIDGPWVTVATTPPKGVQSPVLDALAVAEGLVRSGWRDTRKARALVDDWNANGGAAALDESAAAEVWRTCARQLLDALGGN